MADIILVDDPRSGLIRSDEEVYIGQPVRSWTWQGLADAVNWLNFYARKVLPYTRFGSTEIYGMTMLYPVDGPDHTRYLTVIVGVRGYASLATVAATLASSTDTTGVSMTLLAASAAGGGGGSLAIDDEEAVGYVVGSVEITTDKREEISVLASHENMQLDGWGAWELPEGMRVGSIPSAGLRRNKGVVPSGTSGVVDPGNFLAGRSIDADIDDIQTALDAAEGYHRKILFAAGVPGVTGIMDWHTDSPNNNGSYVSLPTGGIWIPPSAYKQGVSTKAIKVAVYAVAGAAGTTSWRVTTAAGNYAGGTIDTTQQWVGTGAFASPHNPDQDGVPAYVSTAGEWITIDLQEDSGANSDPHITAICIWDA